MPHKLLLADDSVTIQRVIELTFADEDVQVVAVGDGKQAIERVQSDPPDIVLADVGMPERDGYEVAAFIKGNPQLAHIPVLLLTGAFEPIDETRARAVGCDGVLVKPFEPQMVINRVKDLLSGRRPAGLWAGVPGGQPARQPAASATTDFDLRGAVPPGPAGPSGSLEDYFDRLDAAFAGIDSGATPAAPAPAPAPAAPRPSLEPLQTAPPQAPVETFDAHDDLAGWDPDLRGDPSHPAVLDPIFVPPHEPAPARQPPTPTLVESVPQPAAVARATQTAQPTASLADAFAALLAAERGQPVAPSAVRSAIPDQTIDDIVHRVIERLGDRAVRETVLDVAERLVREEIERIKSRR
ncbi:MAG: hypothetical protein A3H96_23025 [Acidobacteria bacterium RIFCSPLOWO2_02_FULL_67_36]|nr:MAG: hypothetical protein A3H96_23025 [Acidobacteria bacterium RIFCSPLOWO2_02_FULL_67_36]OFW24193.1 MAG: hypothetical protein A3G21_13925 [Acidobacteria bacterium RIFCSPLOWO2_12_FULL_66_21]